MQTAGRARENQFLKKLWQVNSIVLQTASGENARPWNSDFSSSYRHGRKNLCSDHYRSWSFQQSPVLLLQVRQHTECQLAVNYPLFWRSGCYSRNQTIPLSPYHLHPSSFIHMYFQNFNQWAMMLHHSSSPRLVWAETDLKFKSMLTVEITVQSSKSSCCWRKGSVNGRKKALFSPLMLKVRGC